MTALRTFEPGSLFGEAGLFLSAPAARQNRPFRSKFPTSTVEASQNPTSMEEDGVRRSVRMYRAPPAQHDRPFRSKFPTSTMEPSQNSTSMLEGYGVKRLIKMHKNSRRQPPNSFTRRNAANLPPRKLKPLGCPRKNFVRFARNSKTCVKVLSTAVQIGFVHSSKTVENA